MVTACLEQSLNCEIAADVEFQDAAMMEEYLMLREQNQGYCFPEPWFGDLDYITLRPGSSQSGTEHNQVYVVLKEGTNS